MSLVLQDVGLTVGAEAYLSGVSLALDGGGLHVLLGPTLSGKTTLMRLMAGLERPTAGRVLEDGADVTDVPVRRRSVAMVYQQFVNYPSLSVYENIASPLRVAGLPRAEVEAQLLEIVENALRAGRQPLVLGYSLGKAQEIVRILTAGGHRVTCHGAVHAMCRFYNEFGVNLGVYRKYRAEDFHGKAALASSWKAGKGFSGALREFTETTMAWALRARPRAPPA